MSIASRLKSLIGYDGDAPVPGFADDYLPALGQHARSVRRLDCGHVSTCYATDRDDRTSCLDCLQEMPS